MTIIGVIIFASLIMTSCGEKSSDEKKIENSSAVEPTNTSVSEPVSESSTTSLKPNNNVKINKGEIGNTNFVEFKVMNVKNYGSDLYAPNHNNDEKFIAAQIQLTNVSKEPIEFDLDNIILTDQEGADYQEIGYFTDQRKKPVLFGKENYMMPEFTLEPGAKASGWVTFTTDKNSNAKQISLRTSSYGNVIVNLE